MNNLVIGLFVCLAALSTQSMEKASAILDHYESIEDLQGDLQKAGMESSNLIIGIDFTGSNKEQGTNSYVPIMKHQGFNDANLFANLHHIDTRWSNPYEQVISIMGRTLDRFDDDKIYPVFGFGDVNTKERGTFQITIGDGYCQGLHQVFLAYRQQAQTIQMSGPTSFQPIIDRAMQIVYDSGGAYHILVIVTDGCITTGYENSNLKALKKASLFPLSILIIGVGDGPFNGMELFDDNVEGKLFDNVQFVNFTELMKKNNLSNEQMETQFALNAVMEIPEQYNIIKNKNIMGREYASKILSKIIVSDKSKKHDQCIKKLLKKPFKNKDS